MATQSIYYLEESRLHSVTLRKIKISFRLTQGGFHVDDHTKVKQINKGRRSPVYMSNERHFLMTVQFGHTKKGSYGNKKKVEIEINVCFLIIRIQI